MMELLITAVSFYYLPRLIFWQLAHNVAYCTLTISCNTRQYWAIHNNYTNFINNLQDYTTLKLILTVKTVNIFRTQQINTILQSARPPRQVDRGWMTFPYVWRGGGGSKLWTIYALRSSSVFRQQLNSRFKTASQ